MVVNRLQCFWGGSAFGGVSARPAHPLVRLIWFPAAGLVPVNSRRRVGCFVLVRAGGGPRRWRRSRTAPVSQPWDIKGTGLSVAWRFSSGCKGVRLISAKAQRSDWLKCHEVVAGAVSLLCHTGFALSP